MYGCNLYLGTGIEEEAWHTGASMYEPAPFESPGKVLEMATPDVQGKRVDLIRHIPSERDGFLGVEISLLVRLRKGYGAFPHRVSS